jgi:hypothetical protein
MASLVSIFFSKKQFSCQFFNITILTKGAVVALREQWWLIGSSGGS